MAARIFNVGVDLYSVTIHSRLMEIKARSFLFSGSAGFECDEINSSTLSGMIVVNAIENIIAVTATSFCQDSISTKSIADERTPIMGAVRADTATTVAGNLKTGTD